MSFAKKNPGQLTFSGSGTYSANHLLTISLNKKAKVKTTYVPFKGTGAAVQALLGKQVVAEAGYSTVAAKQGSKVRMLAVASNERLPAFPDVPTFKELGYNIVSGAYRGYALPKSASKATVKEWSDRIMKINADPAFIKQMEDNAFVVVNIGHNKIKKFMKDQQKANEAIAKELGLSERTIVEHIQLLKGVVCSHGDPVLKVTKQWEDNKSKNTYHLLQLKELYKQSEFIGVDKHFLSLLG